MKIFKKEKEVASMALTYIDAVEACLKPAEAAVLAHLKSEGDTVAELHQQASALESEADDQRRSISDRLFSGAYMPLKRGDISRVLEAVDSVANAAEACSGLFAGEKPEIPPALTEAFANITRESFAIIHSLGPAVRSFFSPKGKIDAIRENVKEAGIQESRVDRQEWDLTRAIFDADDLDLASKMHLKRALDRIVHVPDRAEDAAETLALAAMRSIL